MSESEVRANPYVGLRPFFADDSLYFFGREQQIDELLGILRKHRFLGVVGSSGSGKSSLVRAGLLPGLLGGFLVEQRDRWRTVQIKPGDAPLGNLASGLFQAMGETPAPEVVAALEKDIGESHTDAVIEFLKPGLETNANLFLLVDQFEEIFAFRGSDEEDGGQSADLARRRERARRKAEAADFVDLMLALSEQRDLPIYVVLTMRSDFLGDCDLFYGLPEALNRGRYLVPRMTREQLREAVECPALLLDAQLAPRLIDHLLNELGDRFDRLPVLQHALLRTWDSWQHADGDGLVDLQHYASAGGLEGALDQDAEGALDGLDRGVTARVFKRLTDTDLSHRRVRSPARVSELMASAHAEREVVEGILTRFEGEGRSFVHRSADGKRDDPRIDISHESLIRQWNRLRDWVDEERRSRDDYRELVQRARRREQGVAALLQDPELQMAVDWKEAVSPSPEWARRYSAADNDFECAIAYLDESVNTQRHDLAEAMLQRGWGKIWRPLILVIELVAGTVLASSIGLLSRIDFLGSAVRQGKNLGGDLENAFLSFEFLGECLVILLFLAVCVGLNFFARRLYRRIDSPRIRRTIVAANGGSSRSVEAEAEEAVALDDATYASTGSRVLGAAVDYGIIALCSIPFILFSSSDTTYVLTKGSETLTGSYPTEFEDNQISLSQGAGANAWTLAFTESVTHKTPGGEQKYPIRQRTEAVDDSETRVSFWDGPTISGNLSEGNTEWSLTVLADQEVYLSSTSSTIKLEKGTTVTFPAPDPGAWELRYESSNSDLYLLLGVLVFGWLYSTLQITSRSRATLGMRGVGIFRTDLHGRRLTFAKASAVYLCRIPSIAIYGLGLVSQPFTRKRQTFYDWMTGSVVLLRPPTPAGAASTSPIESA